MITTSLETATESRKPKARSDSGNVLFLILIAVALFAALSYAVTQSTRSGGGDASSETNLVNSSQITQYPASLKTSITRMIISNSITPYELSFDDPSLFSTNLTTTALQSANVFYPTGGGAVYALAPDSVVTASPQAWVFNTNNQIQDIGQTDGSAPTDVTADTIAFLPNVKKAICEKIHSQLGLATTFTNAEVSIDYTNNQESTYGAADDRILIAVGGTIGATATELVGQPQGCFRVGTAYIYYAVLVER
ncbi:MAG: hypothetical protein AUJ12_08040 [Alphaproteobacteria bacterium CG1_02_46_17]|nr:MAG: hypothetical protein AUJ12_08040 [Alphaproteobacteria bacterium CG1_02_46_17]